MKYSVEVTIQLEIEANAPDIAVSAALNVATSGNIQGGSSELTHPQFGLQKAKYDKPKIVKITCEAAR
jgi:hypothetical protein